MHELPVAENLLALAVRHARAADARRVVGLNLVIGDLASVVDDSLQFYWDILSEGTLAEGAALHFRRVPGRLRCLDCDVTFEMTGCYDFRCLTCGSPRTQVTAGDEFQLESIDVETAEDES